MLQYEIVEREPKQEKSIEDQTSEFNVEQEQLISQKIKKEKEDFIPPSIKEKAIGSFLQRGSRIMSERIQKQANVELPDGFLVDYVKAIDEGYVPLLISNHASHADAITASKLTALLKKIANRTLPDDTQIEIFTMPLAKSLDSGHQGPFLRQVYWGSKPVIEKVGLVPNLIARTKDKKPKEEGGYGMLDNTRDYLKEYKRLHEGKPNGTVIYPEGTTEGGKTDKFGLPVGMIPFEEYSIPVHLRLAKKHTGRTPMIIYAGITGSTSAIDPNTKRVPTRALDSFIHADRYKIKVGGIIKTDTPEFQALGSNGELNDFVGGKIASLLPEEMRGVYK